MDKDGWRPIETAPRDGSVILGAWLSKSPKGVWVMRTVRANAQYERLWRSGPDTVWPKFWMPLPPPPSGPRP